MNTVAGDIIAAWDDHIAEGYYRRPAASVPAEKKEMKP